MTLRRLLLVSLPAIVVAALVAAIAIESWVRLTWDERKGTPGFLLSDPTRGNRIAPGYNGWFAGVPVQINALGFRDARDYALDKGPGTFRILVLGDSVTFGHGSLSKTTYPFLLEQRLKAWRPDVDWQVWNLGVPGYNTSQELAYLQAVEEAYQPDLAIVGFYLNDLYDNEPARAPSIGRGMASAIQRTMQRHLWSFEFYKRAFLTLRWRLLSSPGDRQRLENLAGDELILGRQADLTDHTDQQLTPVDTFSDEEVEAFRCPSNPTGRPGPDSLAARIRASSADLQPWTAAVRAFQRLHREGRYPVLFFINMAPDVCPDDDRFYRAGAVEDEAALREILGAGTPVVSSLPALLRHRPSQMPAASGHSYGNANRVKADALFAFLRHEVLPGRVAPAR